MQKKKKKKKKTKAAEPEQDCIAVPLAGPCAARPPRRLPGCTGWPGWQGQGAGVGTGRWDRPVCLGICSWGWNGFTPAAEGLGFPHCSCTMCGGGQGM